MNNETERVDDIGYLEANLSRQLEWVRAAESRLSLVLPLATALFGAIAIKVSEARGWDCATLLATGLAVSFLGSAILLSALSFVPQVRGPRASNIFFGTISAMSLSEFRDSVNQSSKNDYRIDLIEQIHINAKIASRKYSLVKYSMNSLIVSFVPWIISMVFLYG